MRLILCAVYVFVGAVLFALPNLTRRELLFAVPILPDFRESPAGRRAIASFRAAITAAVLAGVGVLLASPANLLNATATAVPLLLLFVAGISFYRQNRKLAPAAIQYTRPREVELTTAPEELPRFAWLAAGPFAILAAVAAWLHLHWDKIPGRFPVHFDASGNPNRWAERTLHGVYGPLVWGAELCAWVLVMALAGWFGSRRSRFRTTMLGAVIAVEYLLGVLFSLNAVQAPLGIPAWVILLATMAILIPLIIVMRNKIREPGGPMDATPKEGWKGRVFYYNPNDAALVVERRVGLGWTFNFANPWSWVLLLGLALVIASARFALA